MKKILILILLSSSLCFSQDKVGYINDLKIYREIIEASHSGMYLYTPKTEFDAIFKNAEEQINTEKITTDREFFLLLAKIHTKINCGHSSVYPSVKIFSEIGENQKALFPVTVKFIKDTLVVSADYKELKKGTQILKINKKSIAKIEEDAFKIISSDGFNTTFKYRQLEEGFDQFYFLLYGTHEKFDLEIIPYESNKSKQITIDGITLEAFSANNQEGETQKAVDLAYIDKNTALLTVNTFSTETKKNQKIFFKFLRNSFKEIKEKSIKNLIIDIRQNTGGDDGNDMELASYLINKPFKENKYRKLNANDLPLYPEYLHLEWKQMMGMPEKATAEEIKNTMKKEIDSEFILRKDGFLYLKEKNVIRKEPKKHLFSGKIYILISGKVFSGGALFSALVRDKSNAIFVGEETGGGYYRHTGSIPLIYELPNSKIPFAIFIVINEQDVDQKIFPNGRGIMPHFEVYPTIKQFVEGKDAVLDFVKEKLKEQ